MLAPTDFVLRSFRFFDRFDLMRPEASDAALPSTAPARRRVRFSLRGLILATALLCAVLSHVLTSYQLHQVRQEARRLRDELGYLTITDTNKLHAIGLALEEGSVAKRWRWRLHIPAGRRFRVCNSFEDIPEEGVPTDMYHFFEADDGNFIFSASAVRDPAGAWSLAMGYQYDHVRFPQSRGKPAARSHPIENAAWLEDDLPMSWYSAGRRTTESVEIGEPLVLLRLRRQKGTHATQTTDPNPTDGIMVWIEEVNSRPLKPDPNP